MYDSILIKKYCLIKLISYLCFMEKPCKECPWKVDNDHNNKLREFTQRTGRKHTCHMVNPKLWDTSNEKQMCKGITNAQVAEVGQF